MPAIPPNWRHGVVAIGDPFEFRQIFGRSGDAIGYLAEGNTAGGPLSITAYPWRGRQWLMPRFQALDLDAVMAVLRPLAQIKSVETGGR
jgi:hypothetical protein